MVANSSLRIMNMESVYLSCSKHKVCMWKIAFMWNDNMMYIFVGGFSPRGQKRQRRALNVEKWRDVTCLVRHISGGTRNSCSGGKFERNMFPLLVQIHTEQSSLHKKLQTVKCQLSDVSYCTWQGLIFQVTGFSKLPWTPQPQSSI